MDTYSNTPDFAMSDYTTSSDDDFSALMGTESSSDDDFSELMGTESQSDDDFSALMGNEDYTLGDLDTAETEESDADTPTEELDTESDSENVFEDNERLASEYDNSFSGEEQIEQILAGIAGKFTTTLREIPLGNIILPKFKKEMRRKTIIGLTGLVGSLSGVVTPIHVMTLGDSDDEYLLLDGTRRMFAACKSGEDTINAVVWDFEDKTQGKKLQNILGLMLNRSQTLKNSELWNTMKVLETVNNCTPGRIEYLLQLQSGDAMKLKDIMLAEGDDTIVELKEKFLNDELGIEAAYKKLATLRKKQNTLERDEERDLDLSDYPSMPASDNSEMGTGGGGRHMGPQMPEQEAPRPRLSNDEVLELLDMEEEDVTDYALDAMKAKGDALRGEMEAPHVQEVGKRHPVDPQVRKQTFQRDNFKCRCCGIGDELYLSILVFHHKIPVFAGGPDTVDNGLTLCANCHLMLHNYVDGHLHGDLADYTEEQQEVLKNIFKYGNIAISAAKKMGLKRSDVHKLDAESRKHMMPDKNVKANDESFIKAGREAKAYEEIAEAEDSDY